MVSRRSFFSLAAALPWTATSTTAAAAFPADLASVPVRKTGKASIAFKSPTSRPNGLQATKDGLWIIDQGPGSRASLVRYDDGTVIRSFDTDTVRPSGITFDGEALWIGSTFSYENIRCDATTGAVLDRKPTPGCTTYRMAGDPPARRSPLAPPPAPAGAPQAPASGPAPPARLTQAPNARFQGAHGQEWRDGKLWTTSTSARSIYEIDPASWTVLRQFSTPGPRPHGLALEGKYVWHGDTDLHAFFKFDVDSGRIVEQIRLAEGDPIAHGLSIWNGTLWYCDDVGVVCRLAI